MLIYKNRFQTMRYFLLLIGFLAFLPVGNAQTLNRKEIAYLFTGEIEVTPAFELALKPANHYIAFALRCSGASTAGTFEYRFAPDLEHWTPWRILQDDGHGAEPPGRRQFELLFFPVETRFVQLRAVGLEGPVAGEIFLFSPASAWGANPVPAALEISSRACPCAIPNAVNRAGWGGPPTQEPGCTPAYAPVTHLFVHHQAGTANPPYAAVVQGIWQFHVYTRGWCDIGYNWVIAPDGTLFEGRAGGNNVVGAHVTGLNTGSMGVCLLGDYQSEQPTPAALETLGRLLAWKCCDSSIDPVGASVHQGSGLTVQHISGHRDAGSTLCPGDNLYARLPNLRTNTDTLYRDPTGCDGLWPPGNDDCTEAITLFSAETCQAIAATTDGATASGVPIPTCNGFTSPTALDVWFRFGATEDHHRVIVTPTGNLPGALDAVVAVYDGTCSSLSLVACADAPGGPGIETELDLTDLMPGHIYYIRVYDYGSQPATDGRFDICVVHGKAVPTTVADPLHAFKIFPNPSAGRVKFLLPKPEGELRVLNTEGVVLKRLSVQQQKLEMDLSGLPAGLYWAVFQTGQGIWTQKLVRY